MKRLVSILFVFCAMVVAQPLDGDSDGVPNDIDQCPNTRPGTPVDSLGCPLDSDHDGVYDTRDLCPGTEPGTPVDQTGCPLDTDGDGVPDYLDKCPNSPVGALVNERGCVRDDDGDGVPDQVDKCPNSPVGALVNERGCVRDDDGDGVPDQVDKCPNTPYDAIVDSVGCPVSKNSTLDYLRGRIDFQTGSAKLTKASFSALDSLVDILIGAPTIKLEIEGHVDNAGPENINLMLSQERAQSVVDYLVGKGIDARRLKAVGLGSSRPVADNGTLQGRKANRRIEFIVW